MEESFVQELRRFGEVHVESDGEVVVKTEPFHTLISRKEKGYIVYSPAGVFEVRNEEEVVKALEGRMRPTVSVPPEYGVLLGSMEAEVKLFVDGMLVVRSTKSGRDFYILPLPLMNPTAGSGSIVVMSTFVGGNRMLGDVLVFRYKSPDDGMKKLVDVLVAISRGEMPKIYSFRASLRPRPSS